MEKALPIVIVLLIIATVVFVLIRNRKDEKKLEGNMNYEQEHHKKHITDEENM